MIEQTRQPVNAQDASQRSARFQRPSVLTVSPDVLAVFIAAVQIFEAPEYSK